MAAHKGHDYCLKRKTNPQHTKEEINKIIKDLLNWAASDDGIHINTYLYHTYGKDKSWLHSLGQIHPEILVALDKAKSLISGKIHNHCWVGDRNSTFGEKILPMYCDEYKALLKWKADITKELGDSDKAKSAVVEYLKQQIDKKSDPK